MTNKNYIILPSLILAVILLAVYIWPKYQDLQAIRLVSQQKEEELQNKKDYYEEIKKTLRELQAHQEALARINSALPDELSPPSLFDYLQRTAGGTGLSLKEIALGETAFSDKGQGLKEANVSIDLSGRYHPDFKRFLSNIENSARLLQIESISFSSPKEPEEMFSFQINLKAHGY